MKTLSPNSLRFRAAFSLVEVTIAMGLFVFALVSLLGLLPVALQSSRDSLDIATAVQVAETLAAQLQANASALGPGNWSAPIYFDDLGNETASTANAVYQATYRPQSSPVSDYLIRAEIRVSRWPASTSQRHFSYLIFDGQ